MPKYRNEHPPFSPMARLLLLLGDQLIRDSGVAVLELVKNAYDADATICQVSLLDITDGDKRTILVKDNGIGMDWATVTEVWIRPGTSYRKMQLEDNARTPVYHRVPLGEKGVGRFAAHKLGDTITMVTRRNGNPEILVDIDWRKFEQDVSLDQVTIDISERAPVVFTGDDTGTLLRISAIRDKDEWTEGKVRSLYRSVLSICSPFEGVTDFKADIEVRPDYGWLKDLPSTSEILELSLFRARCRLEGNSLEYHYEFRPYAEMDRVEPRKQDIAGKKRLHLVRRDGTAINLDSHRIGPVGFHLYMYDRDPAVLRLLGADRQTLKKYLDDNGGVRVYRDGIRVLDYGESGNDWLGLGGRRVNIPASRLSNNQVLGAVILDRRQSTDLVEKTNREGFIECVAVQDLRDAVIFALTQVESERNHDKTRIRSAYSAGKKKQPVLSEIESLRLVAGRTKLASEISPLLDQLEQDYVFMRETLLTAAGSGLSLLVLVHELDKAIESLVAAITEGGTTGRIWSSAGHVLELADGLALLARSSAMTEQKASDLIDQAVANMSVLLDIYAVRVRNGIREGKDKDFAVKCSRRLILATLMNLIDNAIWWLNNKGALDKQIYIGTSDRFPRGPAIVVADNGSGFIDPPEILTQPFFSRKPDGMGIGLYLADQVMKVHGGTLVFPSEREVTLYDGIRSAIVALVFEGRAR